MMRPWPERAGCDRPRRGDRRSDAGTVRRSALSRPENRDHLRRAAQIPVRGPRIRRDAHSRLSAMRPPGASKTGPSPAAEDFRKRCKEAVEGPRK